MFDLEALFAPGTETAEPEETQVPEQEAAAPTEEAFSLPGPAELARMIAASYSPQDRYTLICSLIEPSAQPVAPVALVEKAKEETAGTPGIPPLGQLVSHRGRRNPVLADDGTCVLLTNQTQPLPPATDFPSKVWTHAEASRFLGCGEAHLASMLARCRRDHPSVSSWRMLSQDRTRAAERSGVSAIWTLVQLDGAS